MAPCVAPLATALLLAGAPRAVPPVAALTESAFGRRADLTLGMAGRMLASPTARAAGVATFRRRAAEAGPTCVYDVCPSAVSVPGFGTSYSGRVSRSELFVAGLQKAHIEPIATLAWALYATGLRFDWTPPAFDDSANARGWGSIMVRLRFRIDASNRPVFPKRPST